MISSNYCKSLCVNKANLGSIRTLHETLWSVGSDDDNDDKDDSDDRWLFQIARG